MGAHLVKCTCKHPFQDATYGNLMRVANEMKTAKAEGPIPVRCTVCGTKHEVSRNRSRK